MEVYFTSDRFSFTKPREREREKDRGLGDAEILISAWKTGLELTDNRIIYVGRIVPETMLLHLFPPSFSFLHIL